MKSAGARLTGLRGRGLAADRLNLIRVMPAQEGVLLSDNRSISSYDVLVVGAGVIGLASGWRCAQRGLRTLVMDAAEPGRGATHAAAGMLAPVSEAAFGEQEQLDLNLLAASGYAAFVAELEDASGVGVGFRPSGTLAVALDADDAAILRRLHRFQASLGLDSEWLRGRDCRALEPGLAPGVVGGIRTNVDHQVDPRALSAGLAAALERAGAELVRGDGVARVVLEGEKVVGAESSSGRRVDAGRVVIAAGWRSGEIPGLPGEARVPVRPVKGQIVRLRARAGVALPARVIRTPDVYLVPREDGELVVGATVEERGADESVTSGGVLELLEAATAAVPGISELELVEASAGLRPTSPDNRAIIGEGAVDGLVWATAHWRNGILLAPVTADAVAELVTGGAPRAEIATFSPARFADRTAPVLTGGVG
jgi:glycine oxidase